MTNQNDPQTVSDFLSNFCDWDRPGFDPCQIVLLDLR